MTTTHAGRVAALVLALLTGGTMAASAQASLNPRYGTTTTNNLNITGSGSTGDASGLSAKAASATVSQSLSALFGKVVDPTFDGLVCDGATDNAAAFARAKTRLGAGGTLFIPPQSGQCLTSAAFSVPSNTTVYAYPGTVIIAPTAGSTAAPLLFATSSANNITVYGVTFDGGGRDFAAGGNVAQVYNSTSVVFDHAAFQNTRGIATLFSQSSRSGVRSSTFLNIGNHWKTTLAPGDRQQAVAFCCALSALTSTAQGAAGPALTFSSIAGMVINQPVSGTGIPAGATVLAISGTTITLSQPTTSAVPSGTAIAFAPVGNFVNDNSFTDVGLDAVSMADTTDAVVTGNRCGLANNQTMLVTSSAFAACVYSTNLTGGVISGNVSNGASGNAFDLHTSTNLTVTGNYAFKSGQAGIGWFGGSGVIANNTVLDNVQWSPSAFKGGITLSGAATNLSITGNTSSDDQTTATQSYGVHAYSGTNTNVTIDQSNTLSGNVTAPIGGLITDYTYTKNGPNMLKAIGAAPGRAGTGNQAVIVGPASTYANGDYSFATGVGGIAQAFGSTVFGQNSTANGADSLVGGYGSQTASAAGTSLAWGAYALARTVGEACFANAASLGTAQSCTTTLRATATAATAVRLTTDGNAAGASNCVNIPDNFAFGLGVRLSLRSATTPANSYTWFMPVASLLRGTGAASTTLTLGTSVPLATGAFATTPPTVSATADTTNGCLNLSVTPPAGNTDSLRIVASIVSAEVQ